MTRTTRQTTQVTPSRSDPIDAWLDVLIAMLALPKEDRQRVRDELEDHLRSRTDDLLITGLTEQQALKRAVSELGETADLAKQLSHAHKPPRTRRNLMHAALIALAGTTITLGALTMRPANTTLIPQGGSEHVEAAVSSHAQDTRVDLRQTTLQRVIDTITADSDQPVLVHWDVLGEHGIEPDTEINFDTDPLPHHHAHVLLTEHFKRELIDDTLDVFESDDLIEISTRSHFDARSTERRTYDMSDFVRSASQAATAGGGRQPTRASVSSRITPGDVEAAILGHVEPDAWAQAGGDRAAISLVGASLVVTAPKRIHSEIAEMITELGRAQHMRESMARSLADERKERLRVEYELMIDKRFQLLDQSATIQTRMDRIEAGGAVGDDLAELVAELNDLKLIRERVEFQLDDVEKRTEYLHSLLIEADYASIS